MISEKSCKIESMKRIDEDIKTGTFRRVYLLYGEEDYLKRQYRDKLIRAMTDEGDTVNLARYEGKETSVGEVIDLAETLPFFAERRVICLSDTGFFTAAQEELAAYFARIPETACLIFVESQTDKRTKTFKAAEKNGLAVSFSMPDERTLARWMQGRVKAAGKTMTGDAWEEFLERCGDYMEHMDKEMEKLLSYVYEKDGIERADVENVCTRPPQSKVFDMIAAMGRRDLTKVLELYHDLLATREPPLRILALIVRQFQQMYLIKDMAAQGMNVLGIASRMGSRDFIVRKNMAMAANFTSEQIRGLLEEAADCEERVKSGRLQDRMAVELLMVRYSQRQA